MKKLILAAGLGAALMWFYDPANGSRRRETLQRTLNKGGSGPLEQPSRLHEDGTSNDVAMFATR